MFTRPIGVAMLSGAVAVMSWGVPAAAHDRAPRAETTNRAETTKAESTKADATADATTEERKIHEAASALDTEQNLVTAAEEGLKERGYTVGAIDGVLDPTSYAALVAFQRDQRLPVTGRLDATTFAALDVGVQMSPADPHPGVFTVGRERSASATQAEQLFAKSQPVVKGQYPPPPLPSGNRWLEQQLFVRLVEGGIGPDLVVVADDWQVTLTGEVASEQARRRAIEIAQAFPGVTDVRDQLAIGNGVAASPDTRPRATLRAHPGGMIEPHWLIGQPVLDAGNQRLGTVAHVWAEPRSGELQDVIVARDGGDPYAIVRWDDIDIVWDEQRPLLKLRDSD